MEKEYLILKLSGTLQAWGKHTYEDYRPTHLFPTRSGLLGLLAACLGLNREDLVSQNALNKSVSLAVRADDNDRDIPISIITDFHTIQGVPKASGAINAYAVITKREYLCDAQFTVALEFRAEASYNLAAVAEAVKNPFYTPFLGRRSCPCSRPLFDQVVQANSLNEALAQTPPHKGISYSEVAPQTNYQCIQVRDVPQFKNRQFNKRVVYIY